MNHQVTLASAWKVLLLFLIPFGGGIPAGVLSAQGQGIGWPLMMFLYFISDVILAFLFEPILKIFIFIGSYLSFMKRFNEALKRAVQKSVAHYGSSNGPVALILISFGVDPMTGRAAAVAAGHGFVSGWMVAITGDMISFVLLMSCTLWLKNVLGDGTTAMLVILVLMILAPVVFRTIRRELRARYPSQDP